MDDQSKRDLIEEYLSAYNAFDIDGMISTLHEDIEFRNISDGRETASASGADEFRQLAIQSKGIFRSRRQTIKKYELAGDRVSVDIAFEGMPAVDLPGGLKKGEKITLKGNSEFSFKNNKIYRITDVS
jgi:hypothetical protein